MDRHAKLVLTAGQLAALHHLAIDLAQERGLRRLPVYRVVQEAVVEFLRARGIEVPEEPATVDPTGEAAP
jgi:hypothetical protein